MSRKGDVHRLEDYHQENRKNELRGYVPPIPSESVHLSAGNFAALAMPCRVIIVSRR